MKVKIGDNVFDSKDEPIMLLLSDSDKELISNMGNTKNKYCVYPEGISRFDIEQFMGFPILLDKNDWENK